MAYYPKSKYHVEASKGQYVRGDGSPYYGPVVVTYNNKVFPGTEYHDGSERLSPISETVEDAVNVFTGSVAKKRYPTEEERKEGRMDRYFQQDTRTKKIVEIYPSDYSGSRNSGIKIYTYATASWCLGGRPVGDEIVTVSGSGWKKEYTRPGIRTYNSKSIQDLEKIFPGISSSGVLCNPLEFIEES